MQKKLRKMIRGCCLIILFLSVGLIYPATAQTIKTPKGLPYALEEGTLMSSITPSYYAEVAGKYKQERDKTSDRDPETLKSLRNRLIFMAVSQIDLNFRTYERKRRKRNNLFQTVINILEVGAATAISITNGERAKSIIADGLGFIQGSRDGINKNYRLLERQVLVNKMIERRSKILTDIYDRVGRSDEEYPFERAYVDLLDYFEAGTMDSALNSLATDSGSNASNAQEELRKAKQDARISMAPTKEQITASNANTAVLQTIIDNEAAGSGRIEEAEKKIKSAEKTIEDENKKTQPDATVIENARKGKETAEKERESAQAEQKAALTKLKTVFTAIENNSTLSPVLDDLANQYPKLASRIESSLTRIRAGNGTGEDYARILLKFYGAVVELMPDNPAAMTTARNILDSVK